MQIEFDWEYNKVTVTREPGDPSFHGVRNGAGESRLLYHIKEKLNSEGFDLIKKRMWKDGHLVDEMQQYLRTRSPKSKGPHVYITNPRWAINGAEVDYNEGQVTLALHQDVFKKG